MESEEGGWSNELSDSEGGGESGQPVVKVQIVNEEEATMDGSRINLEIEKDLLIPERQKSKKKRLSQA